MSARALRAAAALAALAAVAPTPRAASAQLSVTGSATAAFVDHRVNAGRGVERASGSLFGALVTASMGPWLGGHALLRGGSLSADTSLAETHGVGELEVGASAVALPWLAFSVSTNLRSYSTDLARQRWISVRTSAEGRFVLVDDRLRGTVRLTLMPLVAVGGLDSPDLALGGDVGLEYSTGILSAGLTYSVERYDFPERPDGRRLEQLSGLGVRIGIAYSR